jgi:GTPase-associated protein 1, N-terminal domain type 1
MVNELVPSAFVVQQTLHGYGDGHRLLAGSVSLPSLDARAMLVLSDISGASAKLPMAGYLTGYPIGNIGKYVLARTWPAPEMSRPGCVWTHSLLIDFADLAAIQSVADLTALFRRPKSISEVGYEKPLNVARSPRYPLATTWDPLKGAALLNALYTSPRDKIVARSYDIDADERLILALWMQQWPRLRRSFRFCSFSAADRSISGEPFDLQLVEGNERIHRSRIPDAIEASDANVGPEMEVLLEDLQAPDALGLRTFLRRIGGDVSTGRGAMVPLSNLFDAIASPLHREVNLERAVDILEDLGSSQAFAAKECVLELALDRVEELNSRLFNFVLSNVKGEDVSLADSVALRLSNALWKRDPANFVEALGERNTLGLAVKSGVQHLDDDSLFAGLAMVPNAGSFVEHRPDLLLRPEFWQLSNVEVSTALDAVAIDAPKVSSVLEAMISAERGDAAAEMLERFGEPSLIEALAKINPQAPTEKFIPWLDTLLGKRDDSKISRVLSAVRHRGLLLALAQRVDPGAGTRAATDDVWVSALEHSPGALSQENEDYLAAFLFARGLGAKSRAQIMLLSFSTTRVHQALVAGRMPPKGWQLINRWLPRSFFTSDWDHCSRIREAVVDIYVELNNDPTLFGTVTSDESLFRQLVDVASTTRKGRRYLQKVRQGLERSPEASMRARAQYIGAAQ